MTLTYNKILPLLVFVAMLAFSVRLVEVAGNVSRLGEAVAADAAKEEAKPAAEHAEEAAVAAAKPEEAKKDEHAAEPAADAHKEGEKPAEGTKTEDAKPLDAPPAVDTPEWVDAGDSDTQFSAVRTELYDNLAKRRDELDKREADMVAREALLRAGEQELDRKFNELSQLRQEIEKLLKQQSDEENARIGSLVKVYEGMKPADAARIFDTLDIDVLMQVMTRMSERKMSPVLALMNAERARTITILMAQQKQLPQLPAAE